MPCAFEHYFRFRRAMHLVLAQLQNFVPLIPPRQKGRPNSHHVTSPPEAAKKGMYACYTHIYWFETANRFIGPERAK